METTKAAGEADRRWISRNEAARRIGGTAAVIASAVQAGQLTTLRLGKREYLDAAEVAALAESARRKPARA